MSEVKEAAKTQVVWSLAGESALDLYVLYVCLNIKVWVQECCYMQISQGICVYRIYDTKEKCDRFLVLQVRMITERI